jgi:hypothetical protein
MMLAGLVTGEGLSELESSSLSFAEAYEKQVKKCDESSAKVCQIFNSKETRQIFFALVSDCFLKLNMLPLAEKAREWGGCTRVSFDEISKVLYGLTQTQLESLTILHHDLVQTDLQAQVPMAYRPLAMFFERSDLSRDERLSGVRFLMDVAVMAQEILELKHTFARYQPQTLGEMELIHEKMADSKLEWSLHALLSRALKAIQIVDGVLQKYIRPLWESGSWMRRLTRFRRDFSKQMVSVSALGLLELKHSSQRLIVALESWFRWEEICLKDENVNVSLASEKFTQTLSILKSAIYKRLTRFEKLTEVLRQAKSEELEGISLYFLLLLSRHEKMYQASLKSAVVMDPSLRQMFKRLSGIILTLRIKMSHIYQGDTDKMSGYPKSLQEQMRYFQYQVPEVLLRGHAEELKKLTRVVRHCYNNIGLQWKEASVEDLKVVRENLTATVTHATSLMRRFQQAGV